MEPERVVIVGAGQTGRGMFGALFYKEGCYELTFADTDAALVRGLREQGHYTVEEKDLLTGSVEHVRVDGFSCVDVADRAGDPARRAGSGDVHRSGGVSQVVR